MTVGKTDRVCNATMRVYDNRVDASSDADNSTLCRYRGPCVLRGIIAVPTDFCNWLA